MGCGSAQGHISGGVTYASWLVSRYLVGYAQCARKLSEQQCSLALASGTPICRAYTSTCTFESSVNPTIPTAINEHTPYFKRK